MTAIEAGMSDGRILFVIPAIGVGGAELQMLLQISAAQRRGAQISLLILSNTSDKEVLERIALPGDRICELLNRSKIMDRRFLLGLVTTMGSAAAFAADQNCTKVVAHMPAAHFFARLLKIMLLLRWRRVLLYQYHHSQERRLAPLDTLGKRLFFGINQLLARLCDHAHWHISEQVRAMWLAAGSRGGMRFCTIPATWTRPATRTPPDVCWRRSGRGGIFRATLTWCWCRGD